MPQYISQMRRGVRYVDDNGATLLNQDGTPVRDDWATYTALPNHLNPLESELVVEYEVNPNTGKRLPRLKIGDGVSEFGELPYMSVDSFILPTHATITVYPDKWEAVKDDSGDIMANRYCQYVDDINAPVTPNSKVDLQITPEDLIIFAQKDLAFTTINDNGRVRVCVVGQIPTNEYTFKATVTEIDLKTEVNEIIGNVAATPLSKEAIVDLIKSTVADLLGSN